MRVIVSLLILLMITLNGFAQNVGIGTNNPNSAAALDITDTTKGILIPRMTQAQRLAIQNPVDGLMVYQTDNSKGLWIFDGTEWAPFMKLPSGGATGKVLTYCNDILEWTVDGSCPGFIGSLNCSGAEIPNLIAGQNIPLTQRIPITIEYSGASLGLYTKQLIPSTGVSGLFLAVGEFGGNNQLQDGFLGDASIGALPVNLYGNPSGKGTANFQLNVARASCTLSIPVFEVGTIASLNCAGTTIPRLDAIPQDGTNKINIPYTGGDGGVYSPQVIYSTGITDVVLNIGFEKNGVFANGDGFLQASITGAPSGAGTAEFDLNIGGQTCTLSIPFYDGAISSINCNEAEIPPFLADQYITTTINIPVKGGDGGTFINQQVASTGVTGLVAYIGRNSNGYANFPTGDGNLMVTIEGQPNGEGTAEFVINIGGQSCTLQIPVYGEGTISSLDCQNARNVGTLEWGKYTSDTIFTKIPYTGTKVGYYSDQSFGVSSGNISGFTGNLKSGLIKDGNDSLTIYFQGYPKGSGEASFELNILGQTCTFTRTVNPPSDDPLKDHTCGAPFVHNPELTYGTMTDQEGNSYKTIQIGAQEWMAENLRVTKYRNGEDIVSVSNESSLWAAGDQLIGAYCSPDFNTEKDCPYGKLYNWYAVSSTNNLCPEGWHVPGDADWQLLIQNLGGGFELSGKMRNTGTNYWQYDFYGATNASGFSALPAGYYTQQGVADFGLAAFFWREGNQSMEFFYYENEIRNNFRDQREALSVRCVKD